MNKHKIIFYRKAIKTKSPNRTSCKFGCESALHEKPLNQLCISVAISNTHLGDLITNKNDN